MTSRGGDNGVGTVFELAKGGSSITALASLSASTGYGPSGGLAMDSMGNLYGATTQAAPTATAPSSK